MTLDQSYEHCRRMASGPNFYPAFFLVDQDRLRALWVLKPRKFVDQTDRRLRFMG